MSKRKKLTRAVSRRIWRRETPPTREEYRDAMVDAVSMACRNFHTWFKAFGWKVKRNYRTGNFTIKPPGKKYRFGSLYCPKRVIVPWPLVGVDDEYIIYQLAYLIARIDYRPTLGDDA